MHTFFNTVLLVLSLCGLALSVYFTLLYYRLISPEHNSTSLICRLGSSACEQVVFTSYGRLFYLPNSAFGISLHSLIAALALSGLGVIQDIFIDRATLLTIALVSATFSVIVGVYLIYALFKKLRTLCVLCLVGHTINVVATAVLIWIKMNP